jgi:predicted kinase
MVRGVGQVGIAGGGQDTVVAENFLDFEQVNARFD